MARPSQANQRRSMRMTTLTSKARAPVLVAVAAVAVVMLRLLQPYWPPLSLT